MNMDFARYVHPDYHYSTTMGEIRFRIPEAPENQETRNLSFSSSKLYIELRCSTINHVANVVGRYQCHHYPETEIPSRVYLMSQHLERDLFTGLMHWKVAEIYHQRIVTSVLQKVSQVYSLATVTDCLLRVDVVFDKYYSPNLDIYEQWLLGSERDDDDENYNGYGMVPASESAIHSLVSKKRKREEVEKEDKKEESSNCSICLEEFTVGCETSSLPCSHVFHQDCIVPWLRRSHYCPLCRFKMPVDE